MLGWTWQRLRAVSLAFGVLVLATGCGGGGGGDTDDPGAGIPVPPPTGQIGTVAWVQSSVRLERDVFDSTGPLAPTASLSIQANGAGYWFRYYHDTSLASLGNSFRTADDGIDFSISFQVFPQPAPGSYTDTLSVILCQDELCTKQVQGSPFQLPLRLDVGYFAKPEEGETDRCFTRLAVYDATTLARRSLLGLAPFERGNDRLQQWGRRLMHRDDGSLIVIAEVRTRGEATPTWLLHRIDP